MRILILGGDGMMGHRLFAQLRERHHVRVTLRAPLPSYARLGLFDATNAFENVDVRSLERLTEIMTTFRPDAVVNCVGIIKQRDAANDVVASLQVNALLPHRLASLCALAGSRLVHLSTDCVFSGTRGRYLESDPADAQDVYGRTKHLGEVSQSHCLTLRTSIVGFELRRGGSLLEWFLAQTGPVKGFRRAIFSGLTTNALSRIVQSILVDHPAASGLYQVASEPIDKYTLLKLFRDALAPGIEIVPDDALVIDRSLDPGLFRSRFGYEAPSWPAMVEDLAAAGRLAPRDG